MGKVILRNCGATLLVVLGVSLLLPAAFITYHGFSGPWSSWAALKAGMLPFEFRNMSIHLGPTIELRGMKIVGFLAALWAVGLGTLFWAGFLFTKEGHGNTQP